MRRLQKVAVLALAVGSLSGMGAGVSAADPASPVQTQSITQPPAAPTQVALQQIGSSVNAPQQNTTLQQAAPQQTLLQGTAAQPATQQTTPAQATTQGLGNAILPAPVRSVAQQPQTAVQHALQAGPQTVLTAAHQVTGRTAATAQTAPR